jgi:parvulin-like peptidyl-prolyl isomerase
MIRTGILVLVWLSVGIGVGCSQEQDPILLTVGDHKIPLSEFQRSFDDILKQDEGFTPDSASARRFLERYIDKTILEQVAADSFTWTPILEDRARDVLESKMMRFLREDAYRHVLDIPDDELRRVYEKARTRYHYRRMYFKSPQEAAPIAQTLREGALFKAAAEHLGFENGGDAGWQTVLEAPEAIIDALDKLGPGEIGGPVRAGGITYLVQLVAQEPSPDPPPPFEETARVLRMSLQQQRAGNLIVDFEEQLLRDYKFEIRPVEITWMTGFLRENTKHVNRGAPSADGPQSDPAPWQTCPLPREDWGRILATCTVDTVSAILVLDHLLSKLLMDWPTFEKEEDLMTLVREIILDRSMRAECWKRGYDKRPDLAWQDRKQRGLMLTRNFYQTFVWDRVRPTLEEARAWYAERAAEFGEPEKRRFIQLHLRDWDTARRAREILARIPDRNDAMAEIRRLDSTAAWVDGGEGEIAAASPRTPLEGQLMRLSPGEVGEPIPYQNRFAVVRLEAIVPPQAPVFETVAEKVVERMTEARADVLFKDYIRNRRSTTPVKVDESVFRRVKCQPVAAPAGSGGEADG